MIPEGSFKGWFPKVSQTPRSKRKTWVQHLRTVLTQGTASILSSTKSWFQRSRFTVLALLLPRFCRDSGCIAQKVWVPKVTRKGLRQNSNAIVERNSSHICHQAILKMRDFASEFRQRGRQEGRERELKIPGSKAENNYSLARHSATGWFCQEKWRWTGRRGVQFPLTNSSPTAKKWPPMLTSSC